MAPQIPDALKSLMDMLGAQAPEHTGDSMGVPGVGPYVDQAAGNAYESQQGDNIQNIIAAIQNAQTRGLDLTSQIAGGIVNSDMFQNGMNAGMDALAEFARPVTDTGDELYRAVFPDLSEAERKKSEERMAETARAHRAHADDLEKRLQMLRTASQPGSAAYVGDSSDLVQRGDGTPLDGSQANFGSDTSPHGSFSKLNKPIANYGAVNPEETLKIYALSGGPKAIAAAKILGDLQSKKAEFTKPLTAEQIDLAPTGTFSPQQEDEALMQMLFQSKNPDALKLAAAALRHKGRTKDYIKQMFPSLGNGDYLDKMFGDVPKQ